MKLFKRLTWFLFVALFLLVGSVASASASTEFTGGEWAPTDESVIERANDYFVPENLRLYVDFLGDESDKFLLLGENDRKASLKFGSDFLSVTITRFDKTTDTVAFSTGNPNFIFSIWEGTTEKDLFYLEDDGGVFYLGVNDSLAFGDGGFEVDDITPLHAPVPAAIILFGSGLLGLVGLKRRS